jgi:thioredoxin reductase (NADPH)
MEEFDVVIIGAGVAGLSAALAAANEGMSTLVLERSVPGGHVLSVEQIANYPGHAGLVSGYDLIPQMQQQAEEAGAEVRSGSVSAITPDGEFFVIGNEAGDVRARTTIIAAGSAIKSLGSPSEERLQGRGISHCAACDGPLNRDRVVAVVGGGDSALEEALVVARYASRVLVLHRHETPTARPALIDAVMAAPNIELMGSTEVVGILGDTEVTGVEVMVLGEMGQLRQIECHGVFLYPGLVPEGGFLGSLVSKDEQGRIVTDIMMQTSTPGIFAAGDIRSGSVYLLAAVAGDGATAGVAAARYVRARALQQAA